MTINSRGHLNEFICPINRIFEMCEDTKFDFPLVSRDVK